MSDLDLPHFVNLELDDFYIALVYIFLFGGKQNAVVSGFSFLWMIKNHISLSWKA